MRITPRPCGLATSLEKSAVTTRQPTSALFLMSGKRGARPVLAALWPCRDAFAAAAGFSFFINVLMLASPLYMMQIYNRVLPSRSEPTLVLLTGLACVMLGVMCLLELIRSRILVRISGRLELALSGTVMAAIARASLGP